MRKKTLRKKMLTIFVCVLSAVLLLACGSATDPDAEELPEPEQQTETEADAPDQAEAPAQAEMPEGGKVMLEDMVYPGSEFLFEVPGFGGPMMPWRFYAVPGASVEEAADFYRERLAWFDVEADSVEEGYRHMSIIHPDGLAFMNDPEVESPDEMAAVYSENNGKLLGVEVSHSEAHANMMSRLSVAINSHEKGEEIPADTTIIVLEYFSNPY